MKRLFTEHPASVGESYLEHMGQSLSFAGPLFLAALACLVHAVFPFLCVRTGSRTITRLHGRMVTHRDRRATASAAASASAPQAALRSS